MTRRDIRRENFKLLSERYRFKKEFCDLIGIQSSQYRPIIDGVKHVGDRLAAKIEQSLGLDQGYMDADHSESLSNIESKIDRVLTMVGTEGRSEVDDRTEAMAIAYAIQGLDAGVRKSLKQLVYKILAGTAQASEMNDEIDITREFHEPSKNTTVQAKKGGA